MSQKNILLIVAVVGVLLVGLVVWGISTPSPEDSEETASIVYYYGENCSHCRDLTKFLEENGIPEKISFVKKEVSNNAKNAREIERRAKECGIASNAIAVPFVWSEGKCFIGTEAENFFREKAGMEKKSE